MPVTRAFRITMMERAARDARFRQHLSIEAINQLLTGDLAAGKAMLRDDVNATISFDRLARKLKNPARPCTGCSARKATRPRRISSESSKRSRRMSAYSST